MATLEPGVVAFGAEDIEKIEFKYWFKDIGHVESLLVFTDGAVETEKAKVAFEQREWLFKLLNKMFRDAASKGQLHMTYDPDELESA